MKVLTLFISIAAVILSTADVHAQKKIGVFVHGFNGGSEKWIQESGVPGAWKSGAIIDDFVALDYETIELASPSSQAVLLDKFITQMSQKGSPGQDQWIIVGHSLGGIISRLLYPKFKQAGFNVVAVVSVGGPSQGAAATDVDKASISYTISRIKDRIATAQQYEAWTVQLGLNWFLPSSEREQIAAIPDYLEMARDTALGYSDHVIESQAKLLIGSNGTLISEINSYSTGNANQHPQNYLSLIGAEKDKAPIRMIGHIFSDDELKDEYKTMDLFNKLRDDYFSRNEGFYRQKAKRLKLCGMFCEESRYEAQYKERLWRDAKFELDRLGLTWSLIIKSYSTEKITYQKFIPPCPDEDDPFPIMYDVLSDIEVIEQECSPNPQGEYRTEHTDIIIPEKNDGVVDIHSVLWHGNDSFVDQNNRLFDDVPADGGYNHFELRNYARAYDLPKSGGGYWFRKGDKNPSMEFAENWVTTEL